VRLFVALDFPDALRQRLRDLMAQLKTACPDARWVKPEGIHVTLKLIGHVDAPKANAIREQLKAVRSERPVEAELRGIGCFPDEKHPRVAWVGVHGSANLAKLAADIEDALAPLGIERETREYSPHLTLARIDFEKVKRTQIEKLVAAAKRLECDNFGSTFGSSHETEFHLHESVTKSTGAEYRIVESFPFVKGLQ
jgi:2'-5' RNA ligase